MHVSEEWAAICGELIAALCKEQIVSTMGCHLWSLIAVLCGVHVSEEWGAICGELIAVCVVCICQ